MELWKKMTGRIDEGPRPWAAGTELGMEAREGQEHFPLRKVVLTWTHSFVVLCLLCVCPGESVLSAADPAPQSSVLSRKWTVSVLV